MEKAHYQAFVITFLAFAVLTFASIAFATLAEVQNISVTTDKAQYHPNEKVQITVTISENISLPATVAIQVFNPDNELKYLDQAELTTTRSVTFSFTLDPVADLGTWTVIAACEGYNDSTTFDVIPYVTLSASETTIYEDEEVTFTVRCYYSENNPLQGVQPVLYIDGNSYTLPATNNNGVSTYTKRFTITGTYNVHAEVYGASSNYITITVESPPPPPPPPVSDISSIELTANATDVYVNSTVLFTATCTDNSGNPVSGKYLKVYVNTSFYCDVGPTNSDGKVSFTMTFDEVGVYKVFVYYPTRSVGSNSVYITVSQPVQPLVLTRIELAAEPTSIQVNESVTFTITCYDQYDEPMAGIQATLTIDGVALAFPETNDDGVATTTYTFTEAGTYMAQASSGSIYSNTVEIQVEAPPPPQLTTIQLTVSSTSIEEGESITFTVKCYDQYGNPMKGVTVTLNVGGETITIGPTDEAGTATYTKTFTEAGTFQVQASAQGITSQSYSIEVTTPPPPPFPWEIVIGVVIVVIIIGIAAALALRKR